MATFAKAVCRGGVGLTATVVALLLLLQHLPAGSPEHSRGAGAEADSVADPKIGARLEHARAAQAAVF